MTMPLFHDPAHNTPFTDAEKLSWLRLIRTEGIGPMTFYRLLERFGSAEDAIHNFPSLSKNSKKKQAALCTPAQASKEIDALHDFGADMICAAEDSYPLALTAIEDAPPVLTVKGDTSHLHRQSIGIVGARNASLNGRKFTDYLARDLGQADQIITSGLARGIDTAAHHGALATGTIAVVAGGLDVVYPPENQALYDQICQSGCVVAESPFGQKPFAQSFPKRNRIISGLSAGVIVVEASLRSGSLITARTAAEQGRDVFAVPGFPMDPRAAGPNKLISDGAILVQTADDVLNALSTFTRSAPKSFNEAPQARYQTTYEDDENIITDAKAIILAKLSHTPIQQDMLMRDCDISPAAFSSALLELEINGDIQRSAGGKISVLN